MRNIIRGTITVALAVAAVASMSTSAHAAFYEIRAAHSNQCLEVSNYSYADRARIVQWPCWGGHNQQWELVYLGKSYWGKHYFELRARHSGKCLDLWDFAQHDGAHVVQHRCWGGRNQKWVQGLHWVGGQSVSDRVTWISAESGKCLDVSEVSQSPGALVYQWRCWGGENQAWRLIRVA